MSAFDSPTCSVGKAATRIAMSRPAARSRPGYRVLPLLAGAFGLLVFGLPSYAQTLPTASGAGPQVQGQVMDAMQPIDARTTSCTELKARVNASGALTIASGAAGGDIFHARIPRCEFWQRAQFSFVVTKDGRCGVGYVCGAKLQS